jgi:hypothetical protein
MVTMFPNAAARRISRLSNFLFASAASTLVALFAALIGFALLIGRAA